jgi:hypothetical protein
MMKRAPWSVSFWTAAGDAGDPDARSFQIEQALSARFLPHQGRLVLEIVGG